MDEPIGSSVYMDLGTLGRLLEQPHTYSAVNLLVDPERQGELYGLMKRAPQALGVLSAQESHGARCRTRSGPPGESA